MPTGIPVTDFNDIVGRKFGRLTVVAFHEFRQMTRGRFAYYKCICDCGKERIVRRPDLLSGNTKSCGCLHRERTSKNSVLQASDTSTYKFLQLHDLDGDYNTLDLTNQKFGRLRVVSLESAYRWTCGRVNTKWKCICDCGNECIVGGQALKSGHTVSCGCYVLDKNSDIHTIDLTGMQFGKLKVLYRVGSTELKSSLWHCKCECGTELNLSRASLVHGGRISCGCVTQPKAELHVIEFFESLGWFMNIDYRWHYKFDDLRGLGGRPLSYDFYVMRHGFECLIECQGLQHYQPIEWFGGIEQFEYQQEHDRRKAVYAAEHNIPLFEIDYLCDTYDLIAEKLSEYLNL